MIELNDSFFEDEIREGFYVPAAIKQCWGAQIEVLNEIDRVCKKHGLKYFACWGTLLGAIRHGGMIPWDDDFDIVMLREDYDRFMTIWKDELPDGFDVINYKTHPDHIYFLSNVVGKSRICFEQEHLEKFHNFPYIAGIDIYTLDNMSKDELEEKHRMKVADFIVTTADKIFDKSLSAHKTEEYLKMIEQNCNVIIPRNLSLLDMRILLYSIAENWFKNVPDSNSNKVTQVMPWGIKGRPYIFDKIEFDHVVELPFETGSIPTIPRYTFQAEKSYGDFMQIYKDVAGHEYPFFDGQKESLKKVLDFDMPEYRFSESDMKPHKADSNSTYKSICLNMISEMEQLFVRMKPDDSSWQSTLGELQQAAIDLGTFMEEVKGEGYDIVSDMETLCEEIYNCFVSADRTRDEMVIALREMLHHIFDKINRRKEIVFMPFKAEYFDAMLPFYESAIEEKDTDVYVVPIPYYYKNYDGTLRNKQYDLDSYPEDLKVVSCEQFNLEVHHPDRIVIQNPYDEFNETTSIPPYFYSRNISTFTDELTYIPWFVTEDFDNKDARALKNMRYYVWMPGVIRADVVYVQSENIRKKYIRKLCDFAGKKYRKIFEEKIVVAPWKTDCEQEDTAKCETHGEKTLVYMPDLSVMLEQEADVIDKMEKVVDTFIEANSESDIRIIWYLPRHCSKYIKELMPQEAQRLEEIEARFIASGCGEIIDVVEDAEQLVESSDAFYGDRGFLMHLFKRAGKPIMVQNYGV